MKIFSSKLAYAFAFLISILIPVGALYTTSLILDYWLTATGNKVLIAYFLTMVSEFFIGLAISAVVALIYLSVIHISKLKRTVARSRNQHL